MKVELRSEGQVRGGWAEGPEWSSHGRHGVGKWEGEGRFVVGAETRAQRREGFRELRLEQCPVKHSLLRHRKNVR